MWYNDYMETRPCNISEKKFGNSLAILAFLSYNSVMGHPSNMRTGLVGQQPVQNGDA
jgi:hypothetical protein